MMFVIARALVRHKVGAVAVLALGVFFFLPSGEDAADAQASGPWKADASAADAQAEEPSFIVGAFDSAIDGAVEYLDDTGLNPVEMTEKSSGNWDGAADAFESANN